jgi:hypothetical protein
VFNRNAERVQKCRDTSRPQRMKFKLTVLSAYGRTSIGAQTYSHKGLSDRVRMKLGPSS